MRRYIFYFSIALLAFGIGSFTAYCLYFQRILSGNTQISPESIVATEAENQLLINAIDKNAKNQLLVNSLDRENKPSSGNRFICENKTLNDLRIQLETDTFLKTYYHYNENTEINCTDAYDVKEIDLNRDGVNELIINGSISSLCNGRGNCDMWIFQRIQNGYKKIFYHESAFGYEVTNKFTNGFANIKIDINSSNGIRAGYIHIAKFISNKYKKTECYSEEWIEEIRKTKLIREKCWKD